MNKDRLALFQVRQVVQRVDCCQVYKWYGRCVLEAHRCWYDMYTIGWALQTIDICPVAHAGNTVTDLELRHARRYAFDVASTLAANGVFVFRHDTHCSCHILHKGECR